MTDHSRTSGAASVARSCNRKHGMPATFAVLALLGMASPARAVLDTVRYTITDMMTGGVMARFDITEANQGNFILSTFGSGGGWFASPNAAALVPALSAGGTYMPGAYMMISATKLAEVVPSQIGGISDTSGSSLGSSTAFTGLVAGQFTGGITAMRSEPPTIPLFAVDSPAVTVPEPASATLVGLVLTYLMSWPRRRV